VSPGAVAGIVIGVAVVVSACSVAVTYFVLRKKGPVPSNEVEEVSA
jgi:hypothetical protein